MVFKLRWFLVLALLWLGTIPVQAQSAVTFEEIQVSYRFAESLVMATQITPAAGVTIDKVYFFLQSAADQQTRTFVFQPHADGVYELTLDLTQVPWTPFDTLTVWAGVEFAGGELALSPRRSFQYLDNRFEWQSLETGGVRVFWYAGGLDFGQTALDVAQQTVLSMQNLTPLPAGERLDVYIYASYDDLTALIGEDSPAWIGSHALPWLGVAVVAVEPGLEQQIQMEQLLPHEIMHLLIAANLPQAEERLPAWYREGLASLAEWRPDPAYADLLPEAYDQRGLLPLTDLCAAFPLDSSRAFLAYAESDSFVRYLQERFGDQGLRDLLQAYGDGLGCEEGVRAALGVPLTVLEKQWHEDVLNRSAAAAAARALFPYLILVLLVLSIPLIAIVQGRKLP